MSKLLKLAGVVTLSGALIMAGACGGGGGGGETPVVTNPSVTAPIAATVNPDGTATTGANSTTVATPPGTLGYLATVSATLAANTVITAKNADGSVMVLTAPPTITFIAPADSSDTHSGVNGLPVPTGFTAVVSTSGAINVEISDAPLASFNPPITITMPVPGKAVGSVINVYSVKSGTTTYTLLGGFTVTTAGFVSFPVSDFCHFIGDPEMESEGSTTTPTTVPPTTVPPTTVPPTTVPPTTVPTTIPPTTVPPTTVPPTTVPTTITGSGGGTL